MTLGLANIRELLSRIGNPQHNFRSIVVAGTNGKGSVTAMAAALISAQGMCAGRYTSPHVYSPTERIQIDGEPVTTDEMEAAAGRIAALHDEIGFSYFEALTAIAFIIFAARGVDVAILETGLGGRFDATNAVDPEVAVITSISLDHRRLLGDTEEEILREKLGISRPNVPLLVGRLAPALIEQIRERARQDDFPVATLTDLGTGHCVAAELDRQSVSVRTALADYGEMSIRFPGTHQIDNLMLAIGAAERICGPLSGVSAGLAAATAPGRFECVVRGRHTFALDVAHNDAALCASVGHLAAHVPRADAAVIFGLLKRKELFRFPQALIAAASRVYLVSPGSDDPEYAPHELLATYLIHQLTNTGTDVILWNRRDAENDHWARLYHALAVCGARVVLCTGSHHVVEGFGRFLLREGRSDA